MDCHQKIRSMDTITINTRRIAPMTSPVINGQFGTYSSEMVSLGSVVGVAVTSLVDRATPVLSLSAGNTDT